MKPGKNIALAFVCMILGCTLTVQFRSIAYNTKMASLENQSLSELRKILLDEKKKNDELKKRYDELEKENAVYANASSNVDVTIGKLNEEIQRLKIMAGVTAVKGKGIIITLNNNGPVRVTEGQILDVINELRASDAQAISVNEERILAMTEVRSTLNYMMVNGRQTLPPFVIKAISNSDRLEHSLKMIGGVVERLEEEDFIKVEVKKSDEVIIPRVRDDGTTIKYDLLTPIK